MPVLEYDTVAGPGELTPASVWHAAAGSEVTDAVLEWPPDLFALTNVILARAEVFRYALSVTDWPPSRYADWARGVDEAGRRWSAWAEDRSGAMPDLVAAEWSVFRERADVPLERLADGREWRLCEALLTLHAIADEACAGLGVALDTADGEGCVYRTRGRELLASTGSLARVDSRFLRVLPKVRTPPQGRVAFSRYACVHRPGIDTRWRKLPGSPPRYRPPVRIRHAAATAVAAARANIGLPRGQGFRAAADQGPVRVLRVRACRRA